MEPYQKFNNVTTVANTLPMPASMSLSLTGDDETQTVRKVRLRAVTSEKDHYLKLMNTKVIRRFVIIQASASILIIICQVLLYATVQSGNYKAIDFSGIGIWGPLLFFSVAIGLSWLTTKSPTGCNVGSALGFQITTMVVSATAVILAIISLVSHGVSTYRDWEDGQGYRRKVTDQEIPGRIICSILILSAGTVLVLSIFISILFCRTSCCSGQKFNESVIFDVETVK